MAVKIRLQRHGKKGRPFYHIVAADARAKRDGRFIEKIGTYNPNTNPAEINIKDDRALYWLNVGAQPSDTARAILKYKGVIYRNHLNKGVAKGAFSQEEADKRYDAWVADKEAKIQGKITGLSEAAQKAKAETLAKEKEINEARAKEIAAANSPLVEEVAEEAPAAEAAEEAPAAEAAEEAPAAEAAEEAPAAEAAEEAPAAEAAEEAPAAEEAEEAPAAEAAEEAPAAEAAEEAPAAEAAEEAPAAEAAEEAPAEEASEEGEENKDA